MQPITIESFMEQSRLEQNRINSLIEEDLVKNSGYGEGQQFTEEGREAYQIMYKTFLTKKEDDKSDLIELLMLRAERQERMNN